MKGGTYKKNAYVEPVIVYPINAKVKSYPAEYLIHEPNAFAKVPNIVHQ